MATGIRMISIATLGAAVRAPVWMTVCGVLIIAAIEASQINWRQ